MKRLTWTLALMTLLLPGAGLWADDAGWYLGGHLGYADAGYSGALDTSSTTNPFEDPGRLDLSGAVAGFQVGFAATRGTLLWGGELDLSIGDLEDSDAAAQPDATAPGPASDTITGEIERLSSLRGRLGYAGENVTFYGTLGFAFAEADFSMFDDESLATGSLSFDGQGFVAGVGLEGALGDRWLWRVEALHYGFDETESGATLTQDNDPGDQVTFDDVQVLRFGASFRFGN